MDCDMLVTTDIHEVLQYYNENKAVSVCKHDYVPKTEMKATGKQTNYPKKNWSSFMLFNNNLCKNLTPEYVNNATPMNLHRFMWTTEDLIGTIPLEWNWLCGEYEYKKNVNNIHYTLGVPCFEEYKDCDYSDLWHEEFKLTTYHK